MLDPQTPCGCDSLSMLGMTDVLYGAEAGTGPGVLTDSSGDRNAGSSGLSAPPLI